MQKLAFLVTTMTLETQSCKLDAEQFESIRHSVKRQYVMTYVAHISKTFMNQKYNQTCVQGLIK